MTFFFILRANFYSCFCIVPPFSRSTRVVAIFQSSKSSPSFFVVRKQLVDYCPTAVRVVFVFARSFNLLTPKISYRHSSYDGLQRFLFATSKLRPSKRWNHLSLVSYDEVGCSSLKSLEPKMWNESDWPNRFPRLEARGFSCIYAYGGMKEKNFKLESELHIWWPLTLITIWLGVPFNSLGWASRARSGVF